MALNLFYIQGCTTCGRKLHVRVVDLGKELVCQHCGGAFLAKDPSVGSIETPSFELNEAAEHWIQKADEILLERTYL